MTKEILRQRRRALRFGLENFVCRTQPGYRAFLKLRHGARVPHLLPRAPWSNTTLKSHSEIDSALKQIRELGLVAHGDVPKNWDALSALTVILNHTDSSAVILDAGAEYYSPLLPNLSLYGYRKLLGINLEFNRVVTRGPIRYEPGDLTHTRFSPNTFDAVGCLSVVEHGVDLSSYFKEMARILKPGGILVTSADYWPTPIHTAGATAYGCPVKIFTEPEIRSALELCGRYGLEATGPVDLSAQEKAICWQRLDLEFTYVIFCLRKRTS
jgi:SAM-dependent methyltransferase